MEHLDSMVIATGFFGTASVLIMSTARVILRRIEIRHPRAGGADPQLEARLDQRLERIEQAVDAIAIEMERVSEGQRFTTRLLTERATPRGSALGGPPRIDTPH